MGWKPHNKLLPYPHNAKTGNETAIELWEGRDGWANLVYDRYVWDPSRNKKTMMVVPKIWWIFLFSGNTS